MKVYIVVREYICRYSREHDRPGQVIDSAWDKAQDAEDRAQELDALMQKGCSVYIDEFWINQPGPNRLAYEKRVA